MKMDLEEIVITFIKQYCDVARPVLLGLSGGPDSLALLHLLLHARHTFPTLGIHLAHIDHGWRAESAQEALQLQKMAEKLNLPWHSITLDPQSLKGNLEAACRQERLGFFRKLCINHNFQAVILGHHVDDQAETVLKRVFEGAYLPYLSGLQYVSNIEGLTIWRPLLEVNKATIYAWLKDHSLVPIEDKTNLDPRFMRGRMRTTIIPQLTEAFGKEIRGPLCHLGQEAQELRTYLDAKLKPYINQIVYGAMGSWLDLSAECPEDPFELKYLVRKLCEEASITTSRDIVDTVAYLIGDGVANRMVISGNRKIFIDRKRIFIWKQELDELPTMFPLTSKPMRYGAWEVIVREINENEELPVTSWEDAWKGNCQIILPGMHSLESLFLGPPNMQADYIYDHRTVLGKWWTNHKIPTFMREQVPVLFDQEGKVVHEFLTGKTQIQANTKGMLLTLNLLKESDV